MSDLLNQLNNEEKRQAIVDKESVGEYILIDIIGKGGFGVVYKALHKTKGYFSAIKKIKIIKRKKKDGGGNDTQSSLMAEINLLKVLSHHNIVRYYDHIPSSSHSYIVMEFIENGSLEKIIKRHGLLPESLVNVYIAQVLNGLEYLHRQGVIHRDIKAANLLISTDGSIKLADFGVATKVSDLSSDNPDDSFAGTPYWMAPEVIQMQGISTACDVWSLGCTIIELLTGTPPYFGLAPAAALYKIVQEDHPPIPQGISSALKDFLLNCFKKDENMRSSAKQLLIHPWVKSIQLKNPESQVKNARLEILSYNAQLQEASVETRPRSKFSHPPTPLSDSTGITATGGGVNTSHTGNLPGSNSNISGPSTPRHHIVNTGPPTPKTSFITNSNTNTTQAIPPTTTTQSTTSSVPIPTASTKSQSLETKNTNAAAPSSPVVVSKQSLTIQQIETTTTSKPQQIDKEKLKTHLQQYSEKDDDDFGSFNNKSAALQLSKLNQFVEQDDEESDFGITSLNAKLAKNQIWNEDEMDGFSDDEIEENNKKKSISNNNNKISSNSNNNNNNNLKLKVKESMSEWDSEIEESFDSISWSENEEIQRTNNIQDKHKEQVIRTIVDFISLLKPNQSNESLINICTKLTELFSTYPEERKILISNGEGGVYFRLPIITLLEILEQNDIKHVNNSKEIESVSSISSISSAAATTTTAIDESKTNLILCLLKLINQSMIDERSVQETICLMNGIPIITAFADKSYPESIREEVSQFVLELCSSSSQSLNMFIAGSRGCKVLVDLLDSDYFTGFSLIHNSLDSISLIFKMNTSTPKTALCHLFAKTALMYRISYLLNQIFNMSESENSQLLLTQKKKVKCHSLSLSSSSSSSSSPNNSPLNKLLNGGGSTSMQNLSKDQFDKVISYSVKAADILLFFSTGDSLVKEEMSQEIVIKYIVKVLDEIYTWRVIKHDIRSFLLKILKVVKNLSMDPNIRSRLDNAGVIPCIVNYLDCHPGIEKISEIYNQVLHSLYYLLLLDKQRQEKALGAGILTHLLHIIDERGPLKELALPILFDFVRSSTNRALLWNCNTIDKLLLLIHDRNWFADAIESIAAWAAVEPVAVFDGLNKNASNYATLVSLLSASHIKHPSFQKSLIPLLYLINGSQPLLKSLIEHGLVKSLTECLALSDSSPVSKITLLKITVCITSYIMNHHANNFNLVDKDQGIALYKVLLNISIQDESEIAKKISENLVKMLISLKYC
ncbi:hypothetical protein CYY_009812 [Polysphondylium violaceum]|uniref:non-specific serine/threonine protein kinase n=1 Tax=Polysphondylium violaceum TaxID=133409 RepID=A0A8J4PLN6_9MYCE|nr:hypothetical protein CYY_009812 [Polysphondylium violaceum]